MNFPEFFLPHERELLRVGLSRKTPDAKTLRDQVTASSFLSREFTGAGCYLEFTAPAYLALNPPVSCVGGPCVHLEVLGMERGIGTVFFYENGLLVCLEMYTYAEPWPHDLSKFEAVFEGPDREGPIDI